MSSDHFDQPCLHSYVPAPCVIKHVADAPAAPSLGIAYLLMGVKFNMMHDVRLRTPCQIVLQRGARLSPMHNCVESTLVTAAGCYTVAHAHLCRIDPGDDALAVLVQSLLHGRHHNSTRNRLRLHLG
jgi:hypothetical protein